jgi:hypothetical protein
LEFWDAIFKDETITKIINGLVSDVYILTVIECMAYWTGQVGGRRVWRHDDILLARDTNPIQHYDPHIEGNPAWTVHLQRTLV